MHVLMVVVAVCGVSKRTWALLKGYARTCGSDDGAEAARLAQVARSRARYAAERARVARSAGGAATVGSKFPGQAIDADGA